MIIIDENVNIKISQIVLCHMRNYIQEGKFSIEAGGILVGKENLSNSDLIIKYLTLPQKKDKRSHYKFIRKDNQHIKIFNKIFRKYGEVYRYIGEWHTHAENIPMYSKLDLENWMKIYKNAPEDVIHYHIIVGSKAFRLWKVSDSFSEPQMVGTVLWEDVK